MKRWTNKCLRCPAWQPGHCILLLETSYHIQHKLLAVDACLGIKLFVMEFGVGEDSDAKEGDAVGFGNLGCASGFHFFHGIPVGDMAT